MQEQEKIDGRDLRDGNWSWVQNELYTLFLPIVGREATHLYQVLAWLIPKRAMDPVFDLSVALIAKHAVMASGTVQGYLKVLHATGMVEQRPQGHKKACMYILGDLRKLARLGEAEIRRRADSVQQMNASKRKGNPDDSGSAPADGSGPAKEGAGSGLGAAASENGDSARVGASGDGLPGCVQQMNASDEAPGAVANSSEMADSEGFAFTKTGVCVHQNGGLRSSGEVPLILNSSNPNLLPRSPQGGRGLELSTAERAAEHPYVDPWKQILAALAAKVNRQSWETWLRPAQFGSLEDGLLVVRLPSAEFYDVCLRYEDLIFEAIETLGLPIERVVLDYPESEKPPDEGTAGLDPLLSAERAAELLCRECSVSDPRAQRAIETAVMFEIQNGKPPAAAIDEMVNRWREYVAVPRAYPLKPRNFFATGVWKTPALWGASAQGRRL